MKIYLATDHAGFELKEKIREFLEEEHEITDCGAFSYDKEDDYPDFITKAAQSVSDDENSFGIIFGASGQGEAICANKTKGIRAAVYNCENLELITLAREHNNANILSIGARFVSEEHAVSAVKLFIETKFTKESRHARRIEKINGLEQNA